MASSWSLVLLPFASPSSCHDSTINQQTHNGGTCPCVPQPAPSGLRVLIRIREEVDKEWRFCCMSLTSQVIPGALCSNIRCNPLKYQRWTNHITLDSASTGTLCTRQRGTTSPSAFIFLTSSSCRKSNVCLLSFVFFRSLMLLVFNFVEGFCFC